MQIGHIEIYYHGRLICECPIRFTRSGKRKLVMVNYTCLLKFFNEDHAVEIIEQIFMKKFDEPSEFSATEVGFDVDAVTLIKLWDRDIQSGSVKIEDITLNYNLILKPRNVVLTEILMGVLDG